MEADQDHRKLPAIKEKQHLTRQWEIRNTFFSLRNTVTIKRVHLSLVDKDIRERELNKALRERVIERGR